MHLLGLIIKQISVIKTKDWETLVFNEAKKTEEFYLSNPLPGSE